MYSIGFQKIKSVGMLSFHVGDDARAIRKGMESRRMVPCMLCIGRAGQCASRRQESPEKGRFLRALCETL